MATPARRAALRRLIGLVAAALAIWLVAAVTARLAVQAVYLDLTEGPFDAAVRNELTRPDFDATACYHGEAWQRVRDRLDLAALALPTVLVLAVGLGAFWATAFGRTGGRRDDEHRPPILLPRLLLADAATVVMAVPLLAGPAAAVRYGWDVAALLDPGCTNSWVPGRMVTVAVLVASVAGAAVLGHHLARGDRSRRAATPLDAIDELDPGSANGTPRRGGPLDRAR